MTNQINITGVRTVRVPVTDQDRALEFYVGTLGEMLRWEGVPPMFACRDADGNGMEIVEQR